MIYRLLQGSAFFCELVDISGFACSYDGFQFGVIGTQHPQILPQLFDDIFELFLVLLVNISNAIICCFKNSNMSNYIKFLAALISKIKKELNDSQA